MTNQLNHYSVIHVVKDVFNVMNTAVKDVILNYIYNLVYVKIIVIKHFILIQIENVNHVLLDVMYVKIEMYVNHVQMDII